MNGKCWVTSGLACLFLGAFALTWSGCSLPQKGEDDAKAKADAEKQKEEEQRKRIEAEVRAKIEKEAAEKQKGAAVVGTKKKEEEAKEAEARKHEEEAKRKEAEEAKKKGDAEAKAAAAEAKAKAAEEKVKAAGEAKAKAAEEAAAKKADEKKALETKQEKDRVDQVKAWLVGLPKSAAAAYCFVEDFAQVQPGGLVNAEHKMFLDLAGKEWKIDDSGRNNLVIKHGRMFLDAEAKNEKVTLNPEPALQLIPQIATTEVLLEAHNTLIPQAVRAALALEEGARRQRVMSNARLNIGLRGLISADQQYQAYKDIPRKTDDRTQLTRITQEFTKAVGTLTTETRVYWKAVNEIRLAAVQRELLKQALEACKARLLALGVPAGQLADTSDLEKRAASLAPVTKKAVTVYKLRDGRQIRAVAAVEMGDQLSLKDEAGKIESVPKTDIVETQKDSP
jgi:hypothetical protein